MTCWYWIALGWAVCEFLAYGRTLAHFHREWPNIADECRGSTINIATAMSALGPVGLLMSIRMLRGKHGFMWRLPPRKL